MIRFVTLLFPSNFRLSDYHRRSAVTLLYARDALVEQRSFQIHSLSCTTYFLFNALLYIRARNP